MLNIIKSEITRLLKSKGFWVSLGIFIFIYIVCIVMQTSTQNTSNFNSTNIINEPGFYIQVDTVVKSLNGYATTFGHSFGVLILGIYLSLFVCHEYSSGYVKNVAILPNGRNAMIISKVAVSIIMSLVILFICYSLSFILGNILIEGFEIESLSIIIKSIIIMFLLSMAMFSLIIFVSTLFKNKTAGIILLFLIASGMLFPFINGILEFVHLSNLAKYSLSYLFTNIISYNNSTMIKIIFISIIYIIVYTIISIKIIQKRDL